MITTTIEELIEKGQSIKEKQALYDWCFDTEAFLKTNNMFDSEAAKYIRDIKSSGFCFDNREKFLAYLKQKSNSIGPPPVTKRNQIFVAMWFSDEMNQLYRDTYLPTINKLNYAAFRIDEKQFNGPITDEIFREISDSIALIADLSGNRGGVYYEAGIAKGLQLCKHPIQIVFTCKEEYFSKKESKPHFDVSGENIIVYKDGDDLSNKLELRLGETLRKNE